jgi:hypothetical protein
MSESIETINLMHSDEWLEQILYYVRSLSVTQRITCDDYLRLRDMINEVRKNLGLEEEVA